MSIPTNKWDGSHGGFEHSAQSDLDRHARDVQGKEGLSDTGGFKNYNEQIPETHPGQSLGDTLAPEDSNTSSSSGNYGGNSSSDNYDSGNSSRDYSSSNTGGQQDSYTTGGQESYGTTGNSNYGNPDQTGLGPRTAQVGAADLSSGGYGGVDGGITSGNQGQSQYGSTGGDSYSTGTTGTNYGSTGDSYSSGGQGYGSTGDSYGSTTGATGDNYGLGNNSSSGTTTGDSYGLSSGGGKNMGSTGNSEKAAHVSGLGPRSPDTGANDLYNAEGGGKGYPKGNFGETS